MDTKKDQHIFPIREAAKLANMTSETLRHYDRFGLVTPSIRDSKTGYRYYTSQDIVLLNTIHALQKMDLPLKEIKRVLELNDLTQIIEFFNKAEENANQKIADLKIGKKKIQLARSDYEKRLKMQNQSTEIEIKFIPERAIMLAKDLNKPSVENLWNYLDNFYGKISTEEKDLYAFEDMAGIYSIPDGYSRLFATCTKYPNTEKLIIIPAGKYLSIHYSEAQREENIKKLKEIALKDYQVTPEFYLENIVISGILQWNYELQIFIEK